MLRAQFSGRRAASLTAEDPLQALLIKDVLESRVQGLEFGHCIGLVSDENGYTMRGKIDVVNWKVLEFIDSRRLHQAPNIIATLESNISSGKSHCTTMYVYAMHYTTTKCTSNLSRHGRIQRMLSYIITLDR